MAVFRLTHLRMIGKICCQKKMRKQCWSSGWLKFKGQSSIFRGKLNRQTIYYVHTPNFFWNANIFLRNTFCHRFFFGFMENTLRLNIREENGSTNHLLFSHTKTSSENICLCLHNLCFDLIYFWIKENNMCLECFLWLHTYIHILKNIQGGIEPDCCSYVHCPHIKTLFYQLYFLKCDSGW